MYSKSLYYTKKCKKTRFEERLAADSVQAPKQLCAYLRRRITAKPGLPNLAKDGALAEKDEDKAEMLASHYASVYTPDISTSANLLNTETALNWTQFNIGEAALELSRLKAHRFTLTW
ncbi:unnamed protein product [Echinostoma caproni]|uniref:Uncharacterized protein n=1 Tax=Echinostoma caproni TaxID=27848 RepID=A0A183BFD6_9TREM|nr:unnamed protein product [Echinostoma caproni]